MSQTCASAAQCDLSAQACDVCISGQDQCNGTMLQTCNASRSGWTTVVDCADAGTCNATSDQCDQVAAPDGSSDGSVEAPPAAPDAG